MPVPPINHPCWQRLAGGAIANIKTQHLGTQLMAKRVQRSSDPLLIHAFFTKWERALPAEVQQLTSL